MQDISYWGFTVYSILGLCSIFYIVLMQHIAIFYIRVIQDILYWVMAYYIEVIQDTLYWVIFYIGLCNIFYIGVMHDILYWVMRDTLCWVMQDISHCVYADICCVLCV